MPPVDLGECFVAPVPVDEPWLVPLDMDPLLSLDIEPLAPFDMDPLLPFDIEPLLLPACPDCPACEPAAPDADPDADPPAVCAATHVVAAAMPTTILRRRIFFMSLSRYPTHWWARRTLRWRR
ncbi:hypothetical protein Y886_08330 [Xanthomonas hyacinthi DSM 19077]|nr:hypothetical protein Y886_08330 [Xanthomonas hyacinthi DSM 19077]